MTKTTAFSLFACYFNNQNHGLNLTGRNCQQRFATYMAKYISTNRFSKETGARLKMEELGGLTLSGKLEAMCPCYDCMDKLFGQRGNVQPAHAIDSRKISGGDIVDFTIIRNAFKESMSITSEEDFISDWYESQRNDSHSKKLDENIDNTTITCSNVNMESVTKNIKKVENSKLTNIVKKGIFSNTPEASQGFKKIKMEKASPVFKNPQQDIKLLFLKYYAEAERKCWAEEQIFKKEQLQCHKSENQN
ncbi:hypothetical protein O181_006932 [Austropuccinia psidii MF-1]|uniref:Uncharacterized protein n=1 Tax=Austropuccinia psidii MF-1 TaxID=1389203 RepID=A0A9Q3GI05_9BASI|nr:hypothetical protein [Austropuccinia psidii MF-1]